MKKKVFVPIHQPVRKIPATPASTVVTPRLSTMTHAKGSLHIFLSTFLDILGISTTGVVNKILAPVPPLPYPSYTYCHRPNFTIVIGTRNSTYRIMGDSLLPDEDVRIVSTKANLTILSEPST